MIRSFAPALTCALPLALAGCVTATGSDGTAAISPTSQAFQSDRIDVAVVGSGPDVVLVPGLSSSPEHAWMSTVKAVPGYRYHLVQVKGFAGTDAEANASGPVAAPVAEEIARYIRVAGLKRPALVGHSMGGAIGLMVAARHPDSIGRLMVVDAAPFLGIFFGPDATVESVRPIAEQIRAAMAAPSTPEGEATLEQTIDGMVNTPAARPALLADARTSDRATTADAYYELLTTDLRPELARIVVPTTVLYVRPNGLPITDAQADATYRQLYASLPNVTLIRVPDSAHFIQIDAPDRFRSELRTFLGAR